MNNPMDRFRAMGKGLISDDEFVETLKSITTQTLEILRAEPTTVYYPTAFVLLKDVNSMANKNEMAMIEINNIPEDKEDQDRLFQMLGKQLHQINNSFPAAIFIATEAWAVLAEADTLVSPETKISCHPDRQWMITISGLSMDQRSCMAAIELDNNSVNMKAINTNVYPQSPCGWVTSQARFAEMFYVGYAQEMVEKMVNKKPDIPPVMNLKNLLTNIDWGFTLH